MAPGRAATAPAGTINGPWGPGCWSSTTTTRSSTTSSRSSGELGADPVVHRNDAIDVDGIRAASPDAILISPGPGRPEDAGISMAVIRRAGRRDPHPRGVPRPPGHRPGLRGRGGGRPHPHARQDLGGPPRRAGGLRRPARPLRRHPLPLPGGGAGLASPTSSRSPPPTADGVIMGLRHRTLAVEGVQFHPESLLTPSGPSLLSNFLASATVAEPAGRTPGGPHQRRVRRRCGVVRAWTTWWSTTIGVVVGGGRRSWSWWSWWWWRTGATPRC